MYNIIYEIMSSNDIVLMKQNLIKLSLELDESEKDMESLFN